MSFLFAILARRVTFQHGEPQINLLEPLMQQCVDRQPWVSGDTSLNEAISASERKHRPVGRGRFGNQSSPGHPAHLLALSADTPARRVRHLVCVCLFRAYAHFDSYLAVLAEIWSFAGQLRLDEFDSRNDFI